MADCLPLSFVTFILYSKPVLSEKAELKQVWITSARPLLQVILDSLDEEHVTQASSCPFYLRKVVTIKFQA